jgi:hypothetical protein
MQAGMVRFDSAIADPTIAPSIMRTLWGAVEQYLSISASTDLFALSDQRLVQQVLTHWPNHIALNECDQTLLQQYLTQRITLIRDLIDAI